MGRTGRGAVAATAVAVLAVGALVWTVAGGRDPAAPGAHRTAVPAPVAVRPPPARDDPAGDRPPDHVDNRRPLRPLPVLPRDAERLAAQAEAARPALERLRGRGTPTPEAVRAALLALGHPQDRIAVVTTTPADPGTEPAVEFGVMGEGGCVRGWVRGERVRVEVRGAIAEWGCLSPRTH